MQFLTLLLAVSTTTSTISAENPAPKSELGGRDDISFVDDLETGDLCDSIHGGCAYFDEGGADLIPQNRIESESLREGIRAFNGDWESTDYNFYNGNSINWQIEDSGIDGTVRGIQSLDDAENLFGED